jgi:hypothetical protein
VADRSLARDLTFLAVGVAVMAAVGYYVWGGGGGGGGTRDEEERPPIIVNNGSIRFEAVPINHPDAGTWQENGLAWRHAHGNAGPPQLSVHLGGVSDTTNCTQQNYQPVGSVELTTTENAKLVADIEVGGGSTRWFRVTKPNANYAASASGAVLTTGIANERLTAVRILNPGGQQLASCPMGPSPMLLIRQR